ncbi:MAG TPA: glycosyltransferase family protein, partial [Flavitalea sp.]|nr:glycosyltransferase family protein [Flavitalea sp.]
MKILYSVQATGNGHISRAMELLPYLEKYGDVDIFLSGQNSCLPLDAPIKYRSKGLSLFYTCNGTLDYWKLAKSISLLRLNKDIRSLPVEKYDLILNDFECITALACAHKKIPSINFGHQASFLSDKTPRPAQKNAVGEWI